LSGLLNGRKVVVIAARGAQLDRTKHQASYMTTWSKMAGIDQQHAIVVEKTLYGLKVDTQGREEAKA
jgi:FMN-dependent NADH-azoreductase